MRIGGLLFCFALVACTPTSGTASPTRSASTGAEASAPEGGNGNGQTEESFTHQDESSGPTSVGGDPQEIIVSGRGFAPQPAVREGTAGATDPVMGEQLSPECVGFFPSAPQQVIKLGGPIDLLRIVVDTGRTDLTLAVRTRDGIMHCNDDSGDPGNGFNPMVELYSPMPGTIEIFVGAYSEDGIGAQYRLGVTEQSGYPSDILRH